MNIDLNCDLGEITGTSSNDEAIMPFITSANIACGFHAGDPLTIEKTIRSAIRHGVGIGAHPGYNDRENFGRRSMYIDSEELRSLILYQAGAVKSMAEAAGAKLSHVKPHGALYNDAANDYEMSLVIAGAVKDLDSSVTLIALSGSRMIRAAKKVGLHYASEVFADRAYNDDGTLVARNIPGAVLHDTGTMIERVTTMIIEKVVVTISGKRIPIEVDTVCIHGDNESALSFVIALNAELRKKGIKPISLSLRK